MKCRNDKYIKKYPYLTLCITPIWILYFEIKTRGSHELQQMTVVITLSAVRRPKPNVCQTEDLTILSIVHYCLLVLPLKIHLIFVSVVWNSFATNVIMLCSRKRAQSHNDLTANVKYNIILFMQNWSLSGLIINVRAVKNR